MPESRGLGDVYKRQHTHTHTHTHATTSTKYLTQNASLLHLLGQPSNLFVSTNEKKKIKREEQKKKGEENPCWQQESFVCS